MSDTCSSDHDKFNVVRVTHDMDSKTRSPQEGSEFAPRLKVYIRKFQLKYCFV